MLLQHFIFLWWFAISRYLSWEPSHDIVLHLWKFQAAPTYKSHKNPLLHRKVTYAAPSMQEIYLDAITSVS